MKVYAICMVYQAIDIIEYVIDHLARQNLDGMIFSDNGSTDGTLDILNEKRKKLGRNLDFLILHDTDMRFLKSQKVTRLANRAMDRAETDVWIIPMDQDEYWGSYRGLLGDVLRTDGRLPGYYFQMKNFIVTGEDDPNESNPLYRMNWTFRRGEKRFPEGRQQMNNQKIIVAWHKSYKMAAGHNNVNPIRKGVEFDRPRFMSAGHMFWIRHYPVRSLEQMKQKYRDLNRGLKAAKCKTGVHAQRIGSMTDEEIKRWYWEKCYVEKPEMDEFLVREPYNG